MEPLSTNQKMLVWLCILPSNKNESKRKKLAHIAFSTALIAIEISVFITSGLFILQNASTDLEASLYSVLQFSGSFGLTYMLITGIFLVRHNIIAMIQSLSSLYNECKNLSCMKAFRDVRSSMTVWTIYKSGNSKRKILYR